MHDCFPPGTTFANLVHHKGSLERLWVSFGLTDCLGGLEPEFKKLVGSVQHFEKLKVLCIEGYFLMDFPGVG